MCRGRLGGDAGAAAAADTLVVTVADDDVALVVVAVDEVTMVVAVVVSTRVSRATASAHIPDVLMFGTTRTENSDPRWNGDHMFGTLL